MKYCSHCGKELVDEAVICPGCGCSVESESAASKTETKNVLKLLVKIFMILGCIASGWALIPLIWTIPMTMYAFKKLDNNEPIGVGFKVCTLLFVNLIAGIILLCMDAQQG